MSKFAYKFSLVLFDIKDITEIENTFCSKHSLNLLRSIYSNGMYVRREEEKSLLLSDVVAYLQNMSEIIHTASTK